MNWVGERIHSEHGGFMALLAEELVEEWLNRDGYFTMRGIKVGVDEIDILAIRPNTNGFDARQIEVQVSFRPMSYIGKLSKEHQEELGAKSSSSAKSRTDNIIEQSIKDWVDKKFTSKKKIEMRNRVFKDANWKFSFVHAVVHDEKELDFIKSNGIELISFKTVVDSLCDEDKGISGAAGTDIAEIIKYKLKEQPTEIGKQTSL